MGKALPVIENYGPTSSGLSSMRFLNQRVSISCLFINKGRQTGDDNCSNTQWGHEYTESGCTNDHSLDTEAQNQMFMRNM